MLRYERDDRVLVKNTGSSAITANSLVKVGNWVGVAYADIPAGQEGIIMTRGVFELPVADPAVAINSGDPLQYDGNGGVKPYDSADTTNPKIGKAFADKAAGETTVLVTLMPELY
ncbi:Predicted phage recombinase, RecA/RadA family [Persephonella hydrogeniphila]|uniref:Predicted phage recombinase, RecA/RadA family n=1 Tax=Persephonella hydrogeniphila TaxID=198703 RepID=A0A285NG26_9AQUI|nr:DUF2190 family protein [Persephonella hydrogeniphila]SNZ08228.1 Predicted phage recombinase, RecA/RadA family [Persephonella hydrogeniphila]